MPHAGADYHWLLEETAQISQPRSYNFCTSSSIVGKKFGHNVLRHKFFRRHFHISSARPACRVTISPHMVSSSTSLCGSRHDRLHAPPILLVNQSTLNFPAKKSLTRSPLHRVPSQSKAASLGSSRNTASRTPRRFFVERFFRRAFPVFEARDVLHCSRILFSEISGFQR